MDCMYICTFYNHDDLLDFNHVPKNLHTVMNIDELAVFHLLSFLQQIFQRH